MRSLTVRCFALLTLVLVPALASAQTSTISGTVRDASGGVLPGVTVEASSPALIEKSRTTVTSNAGTFSIVAYDSVTQEIGVAVQSKYFSVGTAVPWAEAGAGGAATQASVNVSLGPRAIALLRTGMPAGQVLQALAATDSLWDSRQVGIVDARGNAVSWTGKRCDANRSTARTSLATALSSEGIVPWPEAPRAVILNHVAPFSAT